MVVEASHGAPKFKHLQVIEASVNKKRDAYAELYMDTWIFV